MVLSPDVKQALTERFNAKLPLKAAALFYALTALNHGDAKAREAVRRLAHQLSGTAASFGWPEISACAAIAETCDDSELSAAVEKLTALVRKAVVEANVASRILLIEDQPLYSEYLQAGLAAPERSFEVVTTAQEAKHRLTEHHYDLIVLDIMLPDADGRTLLTTLQDSPSTAKTPVIVLSSVSEATIESECLAYGAEAFFDKTVPLDRLSTAMAKALARQHEYRETSRRDPQTGLFNRAGLREAFGQLQAQRKRVPTRATFAVIDVDHFSEVIKVGGDKAGDEALELLKRCLDADLREQDIVGRWGYDEFVVVLPDADLLEAQATIERVQDRLHSLSASCGDPLTLSGGMIELTADADLEQALSSADQLLSLAKRMGRDLVAVPGLERLMPRPSVLVVEDDDQMADFVVELLQEAGLDVDRRADGESAFKAARDKRYATIVVDRTIPAIDGYELIERLRNDRRNRTVPIVMLTAASAETDISLAFDLGADDYVQKPFKPVELVARVLRLARQFGGRDSTEELDSRTGGK